jgi:hypothetical protein
MNWNSAICAAVLAVGTFAANGASAEDFGNESVIALARAGVGVDVLLAKIDSLPCSYDVSTTSILALKSAGVPDAAIAAMVGRCVGASNAQGAVAAASSPSVKRTPGLYVDMDEAPTYRLEKIRPTGASAGKMTGNGSLLFPFRVKLAIPRAAAQTVAVSAQPTFYFYFETDNDKVGDFGTSATASAQSPSEFSLVRFKAKGGQREMTVGKQNLFGASLGIDPKDTVQFAIEEIGDSIFSVQLSSPLAPGEYGFVLKAGADSYRIYDFSIKS